MYLLTLSSSVTRSNTDTKAVSGSHLNSTSVPLARMYGGPIDKDPVKAIKEHLSFKNTVWQPVNCGDMVVYVRRRLTC